MPTPVDTITEISPGSTDWQDVDVTAYVDAGSTAGVLLEIVNTTGQEYSWGVRKNGSTDTRTGVLEDGSHTFTAVGVDSNDIFEFYCDNTALDLYIVGYISNSEGTFFTNAISNTPSSTNTWCDWDISSDTGGNTAVCVFGYCYNNSNTRDHGIRQNGSTDDLKASIFQFDMRGFFCSVDANEVLEHYGSSVSTTAYITGYLTTNFTGWANGKDYSTATTGSYVDVDVSSDVPASNTSIIALFHSTDSGKHESSLRSNGSARDVYETVADQCHVWSKIDGSRIAEQKVGSANLDLYVYGYFSDPSSGETTASGTPSLDVITASGTGERSVDGTGTPNLDNIEASGVGERSVNASGTPSLDNIIALGVSDRVVDGTGAFLLDEIDSSGTAHPEYIGSGTPTLSNITALGTGEKIVIASGTPSLSGITAVGYVLCCPTILYIHNTDAQSGDNNPTGITDNTPMFSCHTTKLSSNITKVRIQVSAASDKDFNETLMWDSDFLTLTTPLSAAGRIENIEYGQT